MKSKGGGNKSHKKKNCCLKSIFAIAFYLQMTKQLQMTFFNYENQLQTTNFLLIMKRKRKKEKEKKEEDKDEK